MTDYQSKYEALKRALWHWSNSKTYEDGCKTWRALTELIGFDPATNERIERKDEK